MREEFFRACRFFFIKYPKRETWLEKVFDDGRHSDSLISDFAKQWFKGRMIEDVKEEVEYLASTTGLLIQIMTWEGNEHSLPTHDIPTGSILYLAFADYEASVAHGRRGFFPAHSGADAWGGFSVLPLEHVNHENCFKKRESQWQPASSESSQ